MDKESPKLTPPDNSGALLTWVQDVVRQARLAWRLFWDQRVPLWTKSVPPAVLAYVLFPVDIITDVAPGLGQLDDLAVILLGVKLFINLAPPEIVQEHLRELGAQIEEWRVVDEDLSTVDGEYEVKK
jgi:uncharacterized membrane protein YkvA (DUF1232 family)